MIHHCCTDKRELCSLVWTLRMGEALLLLLHLRSPSGGVIPSRQTKLAVFGVQNSHNLPQITNEAAAPTQPWPKHPAQPRHGSLRQTLLWHKRMHTKTFCRE